MKIIVVGEILHKMNLIYIYQVKIQKVIGLKP